MRRSRGVVGAWLMGMAWFLPDLGAGLSHGETTDPAQGKEKGKFC